MKKKKSLLFVICSIFVLAVSCFFGVDASAYVNYGDSDNGYYTKTKETITLSDLRNYYSGEGDKKFDKDSIRHYKSPYGNCEVLNNVIYTYYDDPIVTFVEKEKFYNEGSYFVIGDEYGYFVRTVKAYSTNPYYLTFVDGECFYNEVFLFDITCENKVNSSNPTTGSFVFTIDSVCQSSFYTAKISRFSINGRRQNSNEIDAGCNEVYGHAHSCISYKGNLGAGWIVTPVMDLSHIDTKVKPDEITNFGIVLPMVEFSSPLASFKKFTLNTTPDRVVKHNGYFDYKSCVTESVEFAWGVCETVLEFNPVFTIAEAACKFAYGATKWNNDISEETYQSLDPFIQEYEDNMYRQITECGYDIDQEIKQFNKKNEKLTGNGESSDLLVWSNKEYSNNDHLFQVTIDYDRKYERIDYVPDFTQGFRMVERKTEVNANSSFINFNFSCGISYNGGYGTKCFVFGKDNGNNPHNASLDERKLKKMVFSKKFTIGTAIAHTTDYVTPNYC